MKRSKQAGMGKKATVVLLVGLALPSAHLADAQQRIYRVGVLLAGSPNAPEMKGLRDRPSIRRPLDVLWILSEELT